MMTLGRIVVVFLFVYVVLSVVGGGTNTGRLCISVGSQARVGLWTPNPQATLDVMQQEVVK